MSCLNSSNRASNVFFFTSCHLSSLVTIHIWHWPPFTSGHLLPLVTFYRRSPFTSNDLHFQSPFTSGHLSPPVPFYHRHLLLLSLLNTVTFQQWSPFTSGHLLPLVTFYLWSTFTSSHLLPPVTFHLATFNLQAHYI